MVVTLAGAACGGANAEPAASESTTTSGAGDTASGSEDTASGSEDTASGAGDTASGSEDTASGSEDTASGAGDTAGDSTATNSAGRSNAAGTSDAADDSAAAGESKKDMSSADESADDPTSAPDESTPSADAAATITRPVTEVWEYDWLVQSYLRVVEEHNLVVFVARANGLRYDVAVDIESGDEVWRHPSTRGSVHIGYGPLEPIVIDDVYVTLSMADVTRNLVRIKGLDVATGTVLWVNNQELFLTEYPGVCKDETNICAFDRTDGENDVARRFDPSTGEAVDAPEDSEDDDTVAIDQLPTDRWVRYRPDGTEVWSVPVQDVHGPAAESAFGYGTEVDREAGVVVVSVGTNSESLEDQVLAGLDFDTGEVLWRSQGRSLWGWVTAPLSEGQAGLRVKRSGRRTYTREPGEILFGTFQDLRETVEIFDVESGETQLETDVVPYADWARASEVLPDTQRSALLGDGLVVLSPEGPRRVSAEAEVIEPVDPETLGWCESIVDWLALEEQGIEEINPGYLPCTVGDLESIQSPDRLPTSIETPVGQVVGDYALIVSAGTLRAYRFDADADAE